MNKEKKTLYLVVPTEKRPAQYAAGLVKIGISYKTNIDLRFSWKSLLGYKYYTLRFKEERQCKYIEKMLKNLFKQDKIAKFPVMLDLHGEWIKKFGGGQEWFLESPFLHVSSNEEFLNAAKSLLGVDLESMLVYNEEK